MGRKKNNPDLSNINISSQELLEDIQKIEDRKQDHTIELDLHSFIANFDIIQIALGTVIGFSSTRIIEDLTKKNIMPFINTVILKDFIGDDYLYGYGSQVRNLISNVIYFLIVLLIVYLVIRYLLVNVVTGVLKKKEATSLNQRKLELYNTLINKKILNNLEAMRTTQEARDIAPTVPAQPLPEPSPTGEDFDTGFPQRLIHNVPPEPFNNTLAPF